MKWIMFILAFGVVASNWILAEKERGGWLPTVYANSDCEPDEDDDDDGSNGGDPGDSMPKGFV